MEEREREREQGLEIDDSRTRQTHIRQRLDWSSDGDERREQGMMQGGDRELRDRGCVRVSLCLTQGVCVSVEPAVAAA